MAEAQIPLTERLKDSIQLINNIKPQKFKLLVEHILTGLCSESGEIFSQEQLNKLEEVLQISGGEVTTIIHAIVFIYISAASAGIQKSLAQQLMSIKMEEDLANILSEAWIQQGSNYVLKLKSQNDTAPKILKEFNWCLQMPISASNLTNGRGVQSEMVFTLNEGEQFQINFNKKQLSDFFQKLELIQGQLDSLT